MTNDPWSAGAVQTGQQQVPPMQPAQGDQSGQQQGGALSGAFASGEGGTALFQQGGLAPSLFNKTHFVGTERRGKITKAPYEQQSVDRFNGNLPKYWSLSKVGGPQRNHAITTEAIDGPTGKANRPVMDVIVELDTEYGPLSEQECLAIPREYPAQAGDSKRVFVISGKDALDKFRKAIGQFNAANPGALKSEEDLVGLTLTVKRAGQVQNGANKSWVHEISLSRS